MMTQETMADAPKGAFDTAGATRIRGVLATRFPLAIMKKGKPKRPLMIGVSAELRGACPDIPAAKIRAALKDYVTGPTYLRAMVEGAQRVNLQGEPQGFVSRDHAEYAARELQKRWGNVPGLIVPRDDAMRAGT